MGDSPPRPPEAFDMKLSLERRIRHIWPGADSGPLGRMPINALWLMADKVFRIVGNLGVGALIARALGPSDFGVLSAALTGLTLLQSISGMGLDIVSVRALSGPNRESGTVFGTIMSLKLLMSAFVAIVVLTLSLTAFTAQLPLAIVVVVAPTLLWSVFDVFDYWAQAQGEFGMIAGCRSLAHLLALGVRIALLLGGASVAEYLAAASMEILLGGLALAFVVRRLKVRPQGWRFQIPMARQLLMEAAPLWVSSLAIWAYLRLDQFLVNAMLGPSALGQYAAAVRLAEGWYFIPVSMVTAAFPALLALKTRDRSSFESGYVSLLRTLVGIGVLFGLVATWSAPSLVGLIYGPAYVAAVPAFQVLAWVGTFAAWGAAREYWLVAEGATKYSPLTTILGALVNLGLNLWLIPSFGILAAAATTLVAQVMVVSLMMAIWADTRPILRMQVAALAFWRVVR